MSGKRAAYFDCKRVLALIGLARTSDPDLEPLMLRWEPGKESPLPVREKGTPPPADRSKLAGLISGSGSYCARASSRPKRCGFIT